MFLWINGWDVLAPEKDAFDLLIAVAAGEVLDVAKIAAQLRGWEWPANGRPAGSC